jgi:hypothetical protein
MSSTSTPTPAPTTSLLDTLQQHPEEDNISRIDAASGPEQLSLLTQVHDTTFNLDVTWVPWFQVLLCRPDWWKTLGFPSLIQAQKWPLLKGLKAQAASFSARSVVVKNTKTLLICRLWDVPSPVDLFENPPFPFSTKMLQSLSVLAEMCPGKSGKDEVVRAIIAQSELRLYKADDRTRAKGKTIKLGDIVAVENEWKARQARRQLEVIAGPSTPSRSTAPDPFTPPKTPRSPFQSGFKAISEWETLFVIGCLLI